jgi:hypothetical protein
MGTFTVERPGCTTRRQPPSAPAEPPGMSVASGAPGHGCINRFIHRVRSCRARRPLDTLVPTATGLTGPCLFFQGPPAQWRRWLQP